MSIGEKLLELRKEKHLSQEEVANILNVSRQTISKWETDQSTPDFDKIIPICKLYEVTADELLTGTKRGEKEVIKTDEKEMETNKSKKAQGIGIGVLLYFISVAWIMITIPAMRMDPIISSAIFLIICGIATYVIIYTCMTYKTKKTKVEEHESKLLKQINGLVSTITLIIYLYISFTTMAWHITWILWIIDGLIMQIIKLIFMLGRKENEE